MSVSKVERKTNRPWRNIGLRLHVPKGQAVAHPALGLAELFDIEQAGSLLIWSRQFLARLSCVWLLGIVCVFSAFPCCAAMVPHVAYRPWFGGMTLKVIPLPVAHKVSGESFGDVFLEYPGVANIHPYTERYSSSMVVLLSMGFGQPKADPSGFRIFRSQTTIWPKVEFSFVCPQHKSEISIGQCDRKIGRIRNIKSNSQFSLVVQLASTIPVVNVNPLFHSQLLKSYAVASRIGRASRLGRLPNDGQKCQYDRPRSDALRPCDEFGPHWRLIGILCILSSFAVIAFSNRSAISVLCSIFMALLGGICILGHTNDCGQKSDNQEQWPVGSHLTQNVSQKPLRPFSFSYYNNYMANVLPLDKQIAVISSLCEGSSIMSIERVTGVHRDTIMRLGVKVGQGCTALMDAKMRNLECTRLEMDEIWGYIGKKEKHLKPGDDPQLGNVWTYCAIDADTKLVPAFHVAKERDVKETTAFGPRYRSAPIRYCRGLTGLGVAS